MAKCKEGCKCGRHYCKEDCECSRHMPWKIPIEIQKENGRRLSSLPRLPEWDQAVSDGLKSSTKPKGTYSHSEGCLCPFCGGPKSEEHRRKIGESHLGKKHSFKSRRPRTEEEKIRIGSAGKCVEGCSCKRHTNSGNPENGSYGIQRDTIPEQILEEQLKYQGLRYEKQRRIENMTVDFYLPQHNLVIEVNGCYWHGCLEHCPKSPYVDRFEERQQRLNDIGYDSIRIWEHDLKSVV